MSKKVKEIMIGELSGHYEDMRDRGAVVVSYSGVTAEQSVALRRTSLSDRHDDRRDGLQHYSTRPSFPRELGLITLALRKPLTSAWEESSQLTEIVRRRPARALRPAVPPRGTPRGRTGTDRAAAAPAKLSELRSEGP